MHRLGTLGGANGVVGAILAAGLRRREGGISCAAGLELDPCRTHPGAAGTTRRLWAVRGAEGQAPNQPF